MRSKAGEHDACAEPSYTAREKRGATPGDNSPPNAGSPSSRPHARSLRIAPRHHAPCTTLVGVGSHRSRARESRHAARKASPPSQAPPVLAHAMRGCRRQCDEAGATKTRRRTRHPQPPRPRTPTARGRRAGASHPQRRKTPPALARTQCSEAALTPDSSAAPVLARTQCAGAVDSTLSHA
ncbi:hypothetical protein C8J57DRAFT_1493539 [Mycena rebaudengoi]|nr:hypothetical protein C8J57DRAFT_1493539 [Mycena rebaudengoi]